MLPYLTTLFLLTVVSPLSAQTNATAISLTQVRQIRELKPEDAEKNLPVRIHGVITYYDPPFYNLFLQDATAGIFVLMDTNMESTLRAGLEIEVIGVSAKGDFAPLVKPTSIRVLGEGS